MIIPSKILRILIAGNRDAHIAGTIPKAAINAYVAADGILIDKIARIAYPRQLAVSFQNFGACSAVYTLNPCVVPLPDAHIPTLNGIHRLFHSAVADLQILHRGRMKPLGDQAGSPGFKMQTVSSIVIDQGGFSVDIQHHPRAVPLHFPVGKLSNRQRLGHY